ncbi:MAG: CPBP family intramembrane metalloprotease [Acidobacteria bacterium]|nr:CPBP family intramembrane metalloprotease [Acidobacteriota bacterium]MCI0719279.1 CPBP family intramembrane metalloprotease [Acidobacteriota bacterium]
MTDSPGLPRLVESSEQSAQLALPQRSFPVWSGWDVVFLLSFAAFSVVILAAAGEAAKHFVQVRLPALRFLLQPAHEGVYLFLFQALLDFLLLLFIYFTVTLKYNASFLQSLKWSPKKELRAWTYLPVGILLALAVVGASTVFPNPIEPPIEKLLKVPLTAFLFATLGVVVAPFVEEVIFRGFLYPVVERGLGKTLAVVVTALLFSGVHVTQLWGSWPAIVLITVVGFTLSVVRARTDALLPSFIIHLSYNSTICLLFLIGVLVEGFPA